MDFREIDLFDSTSFFLAWSFLNFLAHFKVHILTNSIHLEMWSSVVQADNIPITEKFIPEQMDLEEDIGGLKKMTFKPPDLSDEEKYSIQMPEIHKCDGCMAIAYTLHTQLQIKHLKNQHIKQFRIPESQLLDLFGNFF